MTTFPLARWMIVAALLGSGGCQAEDGSETVVQLSVITRDPLRQPTTIHIEWFDRTRLLGEWTVPEKGELPSGDRAAVLVGIELEAEAAGPRRALVTGYQGQMLISRGEVSIIVPRNDWIGVDVVLNPL